MKLSPDQQKAHDSIIDFWKASGSLLTLGGYAGTGKTSTIAETVQSLRHESPGIRIAFCCFTGKAASVIRKKLDGLEVLDPLRDYCGTIHKLIYKPMVGRNGKIIGWTKLEEFPFDLIIIDEASMVAEQVFKDLQSYGKPILAVGDHGQLPPVGSKFNLMEKPEIRLEKIHRQAEGHPIVRVSRIARETGKVPVGSYGDGVERLEPGKIMQTVNASMNGTLPMILCGMNKTRVDMNKHIRAKLKFPNMVSSGDQVICLKNNRDLGIYNGMTGTVRELRPVKELWYDARIAMHGAGEFFGYIFRPQFHAKKTIMEWPGQTWRTLGNLFDYSYCITVHKSQGSEAESVILIDERMYMMNDSDYAKWLYTGCTRAKKRLTIVSK